MHSKETAPRYIDIFLILWADTKEDLDQFLLNINSFNPALQYTKQHSILSMDYLDLTVYKGPLFSYTNILDTNLHQCTSTCSTCTIHRVTQKQSTSPSSQENLSDMLKLTLTQ